jgi:hypothetical protein
MTRINAAAAQRNGRGRFAKGIEQKNLDSEAVRLYARFQSYTETAKHLNIPVSTAYDRVQRALRAEPDNDVASARKLALTRLAAMATLAQEVADEVHLAHSNGRIVGLLDGETGVFTPLRDRTVNLAAVDRLLRIEDQRSRLIGSYAPTAARVEIVPVDVIEKRIAENEAMIRAAEIELGLSPSLSKSAPERSVVARGRQKGAGGVPDGNDLRNS